MRRRRFKRRLLWAAVIFGLLLLALGATIVNAVVVAAEAAARGERRLAATITKRRRKLMRTLVSVCVVFAIAVGGASAVAAASSAGEQRNLTYVAFDVPKSELYVDAGAKGDSPGDTMFFREVLRRGGKQAGRTEVMCVFVNRNVGRCYGTLAVSGGTLEAAGGIHFDGTFSLPIVGGTGTHAGASGVLRVTAVDARRSRYEIELTE